MMETRFRDVMVLSEMDGGMGDSVAMSAMLGCGSPTTRIGYGVLFELGCGVR